jgi:hypothetical protein
MIPRPVTTRRCAPNSPVARLLARARKEARQNIREAIELYLEPGDLELPENAKLVEVTVG